MDTPVQPTNNPVQPIVSTPVQSAPPQSTGMSNDTKTIITVLLLLLMFPIGLLLMWFWVKWPVWVKIVISLPILIIPILLASLLIAVNPSKAIRQADCVKMCQAASDNQGCIRSCLLSPTPSVR
jgi:hypothetical protein